MKQENIISVIVLIIVLLVFVALVFLSGENEKKYNIGEEVELQVNEAASVDGLRIKLVSITDNTCPDDAECIWSGEYTYSLSINGKIISLGLISNSRYNYRSYKIILSDSTSGGYIKFKVERNYTNDE